MRLLDKRQCRSPVSLPLIPTLGRRTLITLSPRVEPGDHSTLERARRVPTIEPGGERVSASGYVYRIVRLIIALSRIGGCGSWDVGDVQMYTYFHIAGAGQSSLQDEPNSLTPWFRHSASSVFVLCDHGSLREPRVILPTVRVGLSCSMVLQAITSAHSEEHT